MDLGEVLRAARGEARLSQQFVADAVGVTRQALCRWETGARPVRSDDADSVLAACGRDVRFQLVSRHADVEEELARLASTSVLGRVGDLRGMLAPDVLPSLQATNAVVFTGAWAAAAFGLPALHHVGGMLVSSKAEAQAQVAAVLRPWTPVSLAPGGPWGITWDDAVFVRNPSMTLYASVLGEFTAEVSTEPRLELRVTVEDGEWRVVDPALLAPEHVDADVIERWRLRAAT